MKCGNSRIWISPDALDRLKEAMTKEDVRLLIKDGVIRWKKESGHSRGRARVLQAKKRKGRKSGEGKRSGTKLDGKVSAMDLESFETLEVPCSEEIRGELGENANVEYWDIEVEKIIKQKL